MSSSFAFLFPWARVRRQPRSRTLRVANAVVQALTTKYAVAPVRLRADGVGSLAPVASNDSEAGRAKNRRVELVKQ